MVNVNIISKLLTPNSYSRPRTKTTKIKGIVVHWTASPMGNNQGVWNYFERRKNGTNGYGSAHYIVSLEGEIWNCIPDTEIAYHVGSSSYTANAKSKLGSYPNECTVGIEFCVTSDRGNMNQATWREGAKLIAYLLKKHGLTTNDIWLHQEVVGWKDCHRFFVENPTEYTKFKTVISGHLNGTIPSSTSNNTGNIEEFYTVKAGDTLWSISQDFNTTVIKLTELNPNLTPEILKIGTQIRIKEVNVTKYKIQSGDTLWGISRKFDMSVEELKSLNPNVNVYALQVGESLIVSESQQASTQTSINNDGILPNKVLKFGDTGEDVKKLQNALNKLYFNVGFADGIFGYSTKDALERYQSMYFGLQVDGIFGSQTREHMLSQLLK